MAAGFSQTLELSGLVRIVSRFYRGRLTARGRYLLWLTAVLAVVGMDTRRALIYVLFALAAGPLAVAALLMLRRPRVALRASLPARLTAGRLARVDATVTSEGRRASGPLVVGWGFGGHAASGLAFEPPEAWVECKAGRETPARLAVRAARRGRFVLPPLGVGRTDALGLLSTPRAWHPGQVVLAYPRFFTLDELPLPVGRRYQPGGIPLASNLGDSTEFVGTRDFREGDPLRRIHWRSWARRGEPVVKEYQEEYFSRLALVLDTFLPRRPRPAERRAFEAAVSLLASVADYMSRREEVVDVFAAGPDVYEVSAGRSLGYLDSVLDVLACLEPCHEPPFEVVGPRLMDRLARLTTVVVVVLDWDAEREAFLHRVRSLGVAVRTFIVRAGPTRRRFEKAEEELGPTTVFTPDEIERRLAAAESGEGGAPGRVALAPSSAPGSPG